MADTDPPSCIAHAVERYFSQPSISPSPYDLFTREQMSAALDQLAKSSSDENIHRFVLISTALREWPSQ